MPNRVRLPFLMLLLVALSFACNDNDSVLDPHVDPAGEWLVTQTLLDHSCDDPAAGWITTGSVSETTWVDGVTVQVDDLGQMTIEAPSPLGAGGGPRQSYGSQDGCRRMWGAFAMPQFHALDHMQFLGSDADSCNLSAEVRLDLDFAQDSFSGTHTRRVHALAGGCDECVTTHRIEAVRCDGCGPLCASPRGPGPQGPGNGGQTDPLI